jgi:hypothetical protein
MLHDWQPGRGSRNFRKVILGPPCPFPEIKTAFFFSVLGLYPVSLSTYKVRIDHGSWISSGMLVLLIFEM